MSKAQINLNSEFVGLEVDQSPQVVAWMHDPDTLEIITHERSIRVDPKLFIGALNTLLAEAEKNKRREH